MTLSRRLVIALFVLLALSLSANFLVIGFLAGRGFHPGGPPNMMRIVEQGLGGLPPSLRDAVAAELEATQPEMAADLARIREQRRDLVQAIKTEPFDRSRVEAAFAALGDRLEGMRKRGEQAVLRALERATPEERSEIREPRGPRFDDPPPPPPL
ncbi:periplasmic heavy metal sensor [Prosthecomicrobium pneumaticum]|uniref:Putative membrane protein n=1 Tax=Prosthecomicrobium pneumaticum TaxID=81895 RepID=A0A7W9FK97_9HYPH|nr:periplasmic heavy metal sensor [Prosthecomicrobium pneumaticum]MBB5752320.1 putative membrane protein [Prosthecomicrobium pneumaticum]